MTRFSELRYRDCPWCSTKNISFNEYWSRVSLTATNGEPRSMALITCSRCAGPVILEVEIDVSHIPGMQSNSSIPDGAIVHNYATYPTTDHVGTTIRHVPDRIRLTFENASLVLHAGVPSAAAVELRRTLEGAAEHVGAEGRNLVNQIEDLVQKGLVTKQFGDAVTHVRKVGNVGAHFNDVVLSPGEVKQAMRFTEQLLRNLFEVPGELREMSTQSSPDASTGK